jgi:methionine-rich copper-binding protein CopC
MHYQLLRSGGVSLALALLAACAGNGEGLNSQGEPIVPGAPVDTPLTADFQSIQDNVFTPICVRCHSGASAPEGLQLDAEHSYALLVGVPSAEMPSLERVTPGDPDNSYLVQKIEGAPGIVGVRMPFGGPYLPQSTIDVIRQWITNGALASSAASAAAVFKLAATSPADTASVAHAPPRLVAAFSRELDFSLVNETTLTLEKLAADGTTTRIAPLAFSLANGNPATILMSPVQPLPAGTYRLSVRGTGPAALADIGGEPLARDSVIEFTVEDSP